MERLTGFNNGIWGMSVQAVKDGYDKYSVFHKLAEYEDTGLTPVQISLREDDIKLLQRENKEFREEIFKQRKELADYRDIGLTPEETRSLQECIETEKAFADAWEGNANKAKELIDKLTRQLKVYRDAEEQGLLIKLPARIGDELFWINNYGRLYGDKKVNSVKVQCYVWWRTDGLRVRVVNTDEGIPSTDVPLSEIGKTVFLTREAAEEALKGGVSHDRP